MPKMASQAKAKKEFQTQSHRHLDLLLPSQVNLQEAGSEAGYPGHEQVLRYCISALQLEAEHTVLYQRFQQH